MSTPAPIWLDYEEPDEHARARILGPTQNQLRAVLLEVQQTDELLARKRYESRPHPHVEARELASAVLTG